MERGGCTVPDGWGWMELEDLWSHQTVRVKLPVEEIDRRQAYATASRPSSCDTRERDKVRSPEGFNVQLSEGDPREWNVYVYPKGKDPLRWENLGRTHADVPKEQGAEWA